MRCRIALFVVAAALAGVTPARPADDDPVDKKTAALLERVKPGIPELLGFADSKVHVGTGFLIDDRHVVTNAHLVDPAGSVSARFADRPGFVTCQLVDSNPDLDLAVIRLDEVMRNRALALQGGKADPPLTTQLLLVGHPHGLSHTFFRGEVNRRAVTRRQLYAALGINDPLPEPQAKLTVFQHSAPADQGMSGAPVLTTAGVVVGVQREGLRSQAPINFCIPHYYIRDLDLTKKGQPFKAAPPNPKLGGVLNPQSSVRPGDAGKDGPDLSCYHWGFIFAGGTLIEARKAEVRKRVGDRPGFDAAVNDRLLADLVNNQRIVHVTNPAFRFSFLVPNTFTLTQTTRTDPVGTRIVLTSDNKNIPAPLNTIRITAWRVNRPSQTYRSSPKDAPGVGPPDGDALRDIARLGTIIRDDKPPGAGVPAKIDPAPNPVPGPAALNALRGGVEGAWLREVIRDIAWRYPTQAYGLTVYNQYATPPKPPPPNPRREDVVVILAPPPGPLPPQAIPAVAASDPETRVNPDRRTARFRGVLASPTQFDRAWVFHFVVHDDAVIVADYECRFGDLAGAATGRTSEDLAHRLLIAGSLSFY